MPTTIATFSVERVRQSWPGLAVCAIIAAASAFISEHYGAPVILIALLIGMALHFLWVEDTSCTAGIDFAASTILKIAIILLGARITFEEILGLGATPLLIVLGCLCLTILVGSLAANMFGRSTIFGILTAGSVAICGASAALALTAVLPKGSIKEQDTLLTIVAVTTLSTLAMITYPVLFSSMGFGEQAIGFLLGATIHDVAQVAGAGYAMSNDVGDMAIITKLLRVSLLPVVIFILSVAMLSWGGNGERTKFPWFVVGFAVVVLLNTVGAIPPAVRLLLQDSSQWLLVIAIAALGIKTSLKALAGFARGCFTLIAFQTSFLFAIATTATWLWMR